MDTSKNTADKPKTCQCDKPFSTCPHAIETPHGDKWYCEIQSKPQK